MKKLVLILFVPLISLASGTYDLKEVSLTIVVSNKVQFIDAVWDNGFTNRFDIYRSLDEGKWDVAVMDVQLEHFYTNCVRWSVFRNGEGTVFKAVDLRIDKDCDGLPDCREVYLYGTDPSRLDTDYDGISDFQELRQATDPVNEQNVLDTDCDKIADRYEAQGILIPVEGKFTAGQAEEMASIRGGRVFQLQGEFSEYWREWCEELTRQESHFWVKNNGLYELVELNTFSISKSGINETAGFLLEITGLIPDLGDVDEDGLSDVLEIFYFESNPFKQDTDADGIPDYEEMKRNLPLDDPSNPVYHLPPDIGGGKLTNPYYRRKLEEDSARKEKQNKICKGILPVVYPQRLKFNDKYKRSQTLRVFPYSQKITYQILDMETGASITNAVLKKWREDDLPLSSTGRFEYEDDNVDNDRGLNLSFCAPGYYLTRTRYIFEGIDKVSGRHLPWNPIQEVALRKIKVPEDMIFYHTKHGMKLPAMNVSVEFDAVIGDWLPPHGKGETADFVFNLSNNAPRDPLVRTRLYLYGFQNGIQKYYPDEKIKKSEFVFPYLAPVNGYKRFLEKSETVGVNPPTDNFDSNANYIFRIRAKNHLGFVTGFYGRFNGEVKMRSNGHLDFTYILNTNRLSRSLECETVK